MKLNVKHRYESEIKKSNKAFIIIQNYSTYCYIISALWRVLIGNGYQLETTIKTIRRRSLEHFFRKFI